MGAVRLSPARKVALGVLDGARRRGAYVRELLDGSAAIGALDPRDAGLARRLALGVTSTQGCLDELLDRFLSKPHKVAPRVRIALRVATFELVYLGTTDEVAVSQGVELSRFAMPASSGLANAVLRRVADSAPGYLAAEDTPENRRALASAARRAGLPTWLAAKIVDSLGEGAASGLFVSQLSPAPLAAHAIAPGLASDSRLPGLVEHPDMRSREVRRSLADASLVMSDAHAQLIATAATRPGTCLEIGAGRGTKTFVIQAQARRAGFDRKHVALDLYEAKCRRNLERLERAGLAGHTQTVSGDARDLAATLRALDAAAGGRRLFDTVFVDAPCSGTGTMRRHPEIPWRLSDGDVERSLPALQLSMLKQASSRVAPMGELIYATCSVLKRENDDVVSAFLSGPEGACFRLAPVSGAEILQLPQFIKARGLVREYESAAGLFQTVPAPGAYDGHFCVRCIKTG